MSLYVSEISVYPVKSLAAVRPERARLIRTGFEHDRQWMIVDEDGWFITQRQFPWMARIGTGVSGAGLRLSVPGHPPMDVPITRDGPVREVRVWESVCEAVDQGDCAAQVLSDYLGRTCRLVRMRDGFERVPGDSYRAVSPQSSVGFADSSALMLLGEASLADLNARLEVPVSMDRFRPNLVVAGGTPFCEDGWNRIRVGEVTLRLVKDCIRCEIPTIDQKTGEKGVEPMETLESYRAGPLGTRFGRKVVHESAGVLSVGDTVTVLA